MQKVEGFWEDALVISRCEAEHNYRMGEEDRYERNTGHLHRICDIKVGDFVMCQRGDFSKVLEVKSMTRRIETWLQIKSGECPFKTKMKNAFPEDIASIERDTNLFDIEEGRVITYCTRGVEALTVPLYTEWERLLDEGGREEYEKRGEEIWKNCSQKISQHPISAYRRIDDKGITIYYYDADIASECAEAGFSMVNRDELEFYVRNLGHKCPHQRMMPVGKEIERLPTNSLKAYALVTEHGTYVADGLYAKSP